jgi:hypothetical protein
MKTAVSLYCRNDGYKENDRIIICLNSMIETFDEVWYIDWNSPEDKGSLLWEVEDKIIKKGKVRHVIITPEVASQLTQPDASVVNGLLPANLVIRRTEADWIVNTAMDIIAPKKETLNNFLSKADKNTFYTLSRRDIEYKDVIDFGKDNWKEYRDILDKTTEERRFPARVTPNDNYSLINCCGDFQLASKHVWNTVKGFEEKMYHACFNDSNVQKKAVLNGFDLKAIYDIPLYHMSHAGMGNDGSSPSKQKYNDPYKWVEYFSESENEESWGLNNTEIEYEIL